MGVYQTRQEQGQERTWLHLENYETFDIRNKDEKDEIFIGHLPVSLSLQWLFEMKGIFSERPRRNTFMTYFHRVGSYAKYE